MSLAFGDVAGYRYSSSAHLLAQAVDFVPREQRGCAINIRRQFYGFVPNSQILICSLGHGSSCTLPKRRSSIPQGKLTNACVTPTPTTNDQRPTTNYAITSSPPCSFSSSMAW